MSDKEMDLKIKYRTRTIISRGLNIFYPISKDHLCTVTFGLMYGLYSRAACNQERLIMARVRYINFINLASPRSNKHSYYNYLLKSNGYCVMQRSKELYKEA